MHSGATRLHLIVGDPVAQTKSPAGLSEVFAGRGVDAICVAVHASPGDFDRVMAAITLMRNVDGVVITVPHKFAAYGHCVRTTDRARALGAVNAMRRDGAGWFGDMTDGVAIVAAFAARGFRPRGVRALLVGAGGAGSAVALALVDAGVAQLAIHDADPERSQSLLGKLPRGSAVIAASADPAGFGLVVNATPAGMSPGDPPAIDPGKLDRGAAVADLVTAAAPTALVAGARTRGCTVATGHDIFAAQGTILADFLLGGAVRGG